MLCHAWRRDGGSGEPLCIDAAPGSTRRARCRLWTGCPTAWHGATDTQTPKIFLVVVERDIVSSTPNKGHDSPKEVFL